MAYRAWMLCALCYEYVKKYTSSETASSKSAKKNHMPKILAFASIRYLVLGDNDIESLCCSAPYQINNRKTKLITSHGWHLKLIFVVWRLKKAQEVWKFSSHLNIISLINHGVLSISLVLSHRSAAQKLIYFNKTFKSLRRIKHKFPNCPSVFRHILDSWKPPLWAGDVSRPIW